MIRSFSVLAVGVFLSACGGRDSYDKTFEIQGLQLCAAAREGSAMSLDVHLTKNRNNFSNIYANALARFLKTAEKWPDVRPEELSEVQTIVSQPDAKGFWKNCGQISQISSVLYRREPQERWEAIRATVYRHYLNSFASQLDLFSHYEFPPERVSYPIYGYQFKADLSKVTHYDLPQQLATVIATEGPSSGLEMGDQIVALEFPDQDAARQNNIKWNGKKVSISDLNRVDARNIENIFESSPFSRLTLFVRKPNRAELEKIVAFGSRGLPSITASVEKRDQILIVRIFEFGEETYSHIVQGLNRLMDEKTIGVIVDLRNNPGGLMDSYVEVAGLFLKNGLVSIEKDRNQKIAEVRVVSDFEKKLLLKGDVIALVNSATASAAEALAGSLSNTGRAVLIGENSFGKGIIQSELPFKPNSEMQGSLWISTDYIYDESGQNIQMAGLGSRIKVLVRNPTVSEQRTKLVQTQENFFSMSELRDTMKKRGQEDLIIPHGSALTVKTNTPPAQADWRTEFSDQEIESARIQVSKLSTIEHDEELELALSLLNQRHPVAKPLLAPTQ